MLKPDLYAPWPGWIALLFVFGFWLPLSAVAGTVEGGLEPRWTLLAGYGVTHPGLGETRTHVETIEIIGRYERPLTGVIGPAWLAGRHSLLIELPVHFVVDPDVAPIIGLNFLACMTGRSYGRLTPYIFGGGGPLYTEADIAGMGAHVNGNYQFGGGLRWTAAGGRRMMLEYRFHHISNAGAERPNDPLNGSKVLLGMEF